MVQPLMRVWDLDAGRFRSCSLRTRFPGVFPGVLVPRGGWSSADPRRHQIQLGCLQVGQLQSLQVQLAHVSSQFSQLHVA